MTIKYEIHPLAQIFPDIEGPAFDALVEDIKERGLQEPICLFENKILDGKNRAKACEQLGRDPLIRTFAGTDPVAFVLSVNLHRRHLNESQRAMVAARLAKLELGVNQHTKGQGTSIEAASRLLNVGRASVERAKKVLGSGSLEIIQSVDKGEQAVSAVATELAQQQEQQGTGSTKKGKGKGKGKGKSKRDQKPKTVIEFITPYDTQSAANAYRVLSDHLLEALDDLQALSSVGHATEYAERTIEVLQEKIAQMLPEEEEETEFPTYKAA
jgi:ParB-like chromosome segregation protein Spo0J